MKKFLMIALTLVLTLSLLLTSCGDVITGKDDNSDVNSDGMHTDGNNDTTQNGEENSGNNDGITLNGIDGKTAAELLLTQARLDQSAVSNGLNFHLSSDALSVVNSAPRFDLLSATGNTETDGTVISPNSEIIMDNDGGRMVVDGSVWYWSDFQDYSSELSFYQSYINAIEFSANRAAENISNIKSRVNITDCWLNLDGQNCLLSVGESSETLYTVETTDRDPMISICNHYVDENGRDVYEMYYSFTDVDGSRGREYLVYIDGEYYEYNYDYQPADGAWDKHYRPRIIIDKTRGYWNLFSMTDVMGEPGVDDRPHFNVSNLVVKEDAVYTVRGSVFPDQDFEDSNFIYEVYSPDLKNQIVGFTSGLDYISVHLGSLTGIEHISIDSANPGNSYCHLFDDGTRIAWGPEMTVKLSNGRILKQGDVFADGNATYGQGTVQVDFMGSKSGGPIYYGCIDISFHTSESADYKDRIGYMEQMLAECGIGSKYGTDVLISTIDEALETSKQFGHYYKWNGMSVNTYDSLEEASKPLYDIYDRFAELYNGVKDLPYVELDNYIEPLPEELTFAPFSGFNYGKITIENGIISAEEMLATVPDHVLLDDGSDYVLRLGLRKYKDDGVTASETIVALHGDNEIFSRYTVGNAVVLRQGSNYTIPHNLSEGKYLLVAYVATADEGIRISETVPIASVDFTSGSVESVSMDITYERGDSDILVVSSLSKLYLEYLLPESDEPYTYAAILELLKFEALNHGSIDENSSLEKYDFETKQAEAVDVDSKIVAGTYRYKYSSAAHDGSDAYIYCVVTEEMLPTVSDTETESGSESETENDSKIEGSTESSTESGTESSTESGTESDTESDSKTESAPADTTA